LLFARFSGGLKDFFGGISLSSKKGMYVLRPDCGHNMVTKLTILLRYLPCRKELKKISPKSKFYHLIHLGFTGV